MVEGERRTVELSELGQREAGWLFQQWLRLP